MADKSIDMLVAATAVNPNDLFVLQQSATAKKLTGQILENWLVSLADGHGGIQSISKTSTSGLVDTYTITYADTTTSTFTVTNGKAINSITIYYAVSNSDSTAPSSGWSTSYQQMTQTNRFLWSYEVIAFNNNTSITTEKVVIGVYGQKGDTGATGNGIASMSAGTHTPGEYTVYTFTFTNGTTQSWYSYDGVGIESIAKTQTVGLVDTYTVSYTNNTTSTFTVTNAKSIVSVTKTSTLGLVDTYTVTFNDGTSTTFTVTNGSSIESIAKTSTVGLVDTYTVELTDGTSTTFTVTNAKSIVSIEQTSGTHAPGTSDTYTITFNDGDTTAFQVYNGTNGTGSVSSVDGIQANGDQDVILLLTGNGAPTTTTAGQLHQRYFDLSSQILYICTAVDTTTTPTTYTWAGTGVPVDSSLSTASENPVQNKVITGKVGTVALNTTAQNLSGAVNELKSSIPTAYTSNPAMDGTASPGSSTSWAKGNHVHPTDTNLKQNIENKFQKSTSEFVGQTITNISISNGTEANPGNTNAVHTGWISCKYGDVVSVEVLRKPKNAGDYFVFGYSTYPATTSSTAYRIRYADFDIDTTGNNKVQIKLPAETNISFAIAESTGSGATALRETDFSSGDVIVKIEHSVVEDDVNFYESYAEKSIAQPAKLASTDVRLRVLSYNVSGYKCDTSVDSISTAKQQGLRNFLGDIKADFAGLQENTKYTTGSSGSKTVQNYIWYSSFADWFHADKYSQVIFSRYARTSGGANSVKVAFSNATGENRALMAVSFPFGNKTLLVCSFHAIWADMGGSALDSANVTARQTQFTELFNWVNGSITLKSLADLTTDVSCPTHTHAVILGDFNTITDTDKTNLQTIASSASFTLGNGGRFGWMYTDRSANGNFSLDNIAVSSNVALDSFEPKWDWYGKLYSDHVPIVSDIILQGTP